MIVDQRDLAKAIRDGLAQFEATKALPMEVRRVRLEPGDTLVIRMPGQLTLEANRRIGEYLTGRFPGHQVIVLEQGMDLEVISTEKAQ